MLQGFLKDLEEQVLQVAGCIRDQNNIDNHDAEEQVLQVAEEIKIISIIIFYLLSLVCDCIGITRLMSN